MAKFSKIFGFIIFLICMGCSQKARVNLPEEKLLKDIEHPDSSLKAAFITDLDNFPVTTPKNGCQYLESRYKIAGNPLPVIDLTGNRQNVRSLRLSQLGGNIKYLKIKFPKAQSQSSTSVRGAMGSNNANMDSPTHIVETNNYLIISGLSGIFLYSKNGILLDTLYKNKLVILENSKKGYCYKPVKMVFDKPAIDTVGGKIYLHERNWEKRQSRLLEFKAEFLNNPIINRTGSEKRAFSMQLTKAFNLDRQTERIDLLSSNIMVLHASTMRNMDKQPTIMALFSTNGDTLCGFKNNLPFQPFVSGVSRDPEDRKGFRFNNQYTFKQEYSDTVFRVIPPNQLSPCYIFNLGNKKLSANEAYNPKINIDDRIYIQDFFETSDYIVIRLVLGFDCPYNRKADKVHFLGAYYDKHTGQVFYLPGKGIVPEDFTILNDIDGGLPFWPQEITDTGDLFSWVDGQTMKERLTEEWFSKSSAPAARKAALKEFVKSLQDDDCVIMTVK